MGVAGAEGEAGGAGNAQIDGAKSLQIALLFVCAGLEIN